jgi:uncharacterized protein Yka (UPF0111/DUF47 family)
MTDDQKRLLAVFEVRVHDLMALCNQQKQEIQGLTNALNSKNDELKQAMKTIRELEAKCDSMLIARIVSLREKEIKGAKARLSNLVREVDKCIALLNE